MCCMMMGHRMDHDTETHSSTEPVRQTETLVDVLRRRYALGEISSEQMEEMKRVLGLTADSAVEAGGNAWETSHHG